MNLIDLFIIIILIVALFRGAQLGLFYVFFSIATTLLGLLLGSWLGQIIAQHVVGELTRMLIIVGCAAGGAVIVSEIGVLIASHLTKKSEDLSLDKVNTVGGAGLEFVFVLILFWLVSPALLNVRSGQLGRQVRESAIVGSLQGRFGQPPDVFAQIASTISPNGFPNVFSFDEPVLPTPAAPTALDPAVIAKASTSVVKVEGQGCGGIVDGSGWVVDDGLVVTNAHVVSGIVSPAVIDGRRTLRATPVLFDPNLDLAVLRVSGLDLATLPLRTTLLPDGASGASIGFPGGGQKTVSASVVIDHVIAEGRNIYNRGRIERQIYELSDDVEEGDSGGPLIDETGAVAGIVFAKSIGQANVGYAITLPQALPSIRTAQNSTTAVSTGGCSVE